MPQQSASSAGIAGSSVPGSVSDASVRTEKSARNSTQSALRNEMFPTVEKKRGSSIAGEIARSPRRSAPKTSPIASAAAIEKPSPIA